MAEKKNSGHLMPLPEIRQNPTGLVSGSASEVSDWRPTKKQAAFLIALSQIGLNRTVRAVCEEANVHPSTYYEWIKDQSFLDACGEVARRIIQTAVPMTLSAMGQKAADGNTSAARLILQTAGMVGSGGTEVHVGDRIRNQLNVHGQQPGRQAHGDHRDVVFRAANATEFGITVEIGERLAAEMLARAERGEPELTDEQQLRSIKIATELVISERSAKEAEEAEAPVIDITPTEQGEAD